MIEALMIWNEPNNMSHWDFEIDPGWTSFAGMAKLAADAIRAESDLPRVLGGISPIDPKFIGNMKDQGVLDKKLRTGLSWADSFRPNADAWFDRQMKALDGFDVTLTYCFTPEHCGVKPHTRARRNAARSSPTSARG